MSPSVGYSVISSKLVAQASLICNLLCKQFNTIHMFMVEEINTFLEVLMMPIACEWFSVSIFIVVYI